MTRRQSLLSTLLIATMAFSSTAVLADPPHGKGRGPDKHDKYDHRKDDRRDWDRGRDRAYIRDSDKVIIRQYIVNDYRARYHCPPGLARKHNGCLPPGHARYYIGQPLPSYLEWRPVPRPLLVRLQPVPYGYRYIMVDNDVLLMSEASHEIIDAITLLSAMN